MSIFESRDIELILINLDYLSKKKSDPLYIALLEMLNEYRVKDALINLNEKMCEYWSSTELSDLTKGLELSAFDKVQKELKDYIVSKPRKAKALYVSFLKMLSMLLVASTRVNEILEEKIEDTKLSDSLLGLQEEKSYIDSELELADISDEDYLEKYECLLDVEKSIFDKVKEIKNGKNNKKRELEHEQKVITGIFNELINNKLVRSDKDVIGECKDLILSVLFQIKIIENSMDFRFGIEVPDVGKVPILTSNEVLLEKLESIDANSLPIVCTVFLPHTQAIETLQKSINRHIHALGLLLRKLEFGEQFISLVPPLPAAFAKVKKFRIFDKSGNVLLTTNKGAEILRFKTMLEAEQWWTAFEESDGLSVKLKRTPPPTSTPKIRKTKSTPIIGKRTHVVGGGNGKAICRTCNGTGLWGNCRTCGGKGFL